MQVPNTQMKKDSKFIGQTNPQHLQTLIPISQINHLKQCVRKEDEEEVVIENWTFDCEETHLNLGRTRWRVTVAARKSTIEIETLEETVWELQRWEERMSLQNAPFWVSFFWSITGLGFNKMIIIWAGFVVLDSHKMFDPILKMEVSFAFTGF